MTREKLYGGVEAGGTKFVCCIASGPNHIVEEVRFATTSPQETLKKTVQFFQPYVTDGKIRSVGVGCFGPLDLIPDSPTYGFITATPKPGWSNTDVRGTLERGLNIPVAIDSDVNAAAVGETIWGASRGVDPCLYLTIGTGIGGGYVKDGKPLIGLVNLEMGHIRIPHNHDLDPFQGNCPFHDDCFEGLASGPAIEKRLGVKGALVPESDPFWNLEADYIAFALMNYILTLSPKRIILGGGVMQREFLLPRVRNRVCELLNGYVASRVILEKISQYIVSPGLGNQSGSMGAIALAMQVEETMKDPRS